MIHCHNGPTAIHTRLGWVLSGPVQGSPPARVTSVNLVITHLLRVDAFQQQTLGKLDNQLKMFWDLESLGIKCDASTVYEEFQKKITYSTARFKLHTCTRAKSYCTQHSWQCSRVARSCSRVTHPCSRVTRLCSQVARLRVFSSARITTARKLLVTSN